MTGSKRTNEPRAKPWIVTLLEHPHFRARAGLVFGGVVITLVILEVGMRLFYPHAFAAPPDEISLTYHYDSDLGWFPVPNSQKRITASRTITAVHNSEGFRAPEPSKPIKPGLIFLGDSLVWGFDVEAPDR